MTFFTRQERIVILLCGGILTAGSLLIMACRVLPEVERVLYVLDLHAFLPKIELNTVTAEELETAAGIGPTIAQRVVKYRRLIGGFKRVDQLKEVYGISDQMFENLRPRLYIRKASQ